MAFEALYLQTGETPARLDRWWIEELFSEGVRNLDTGGLLVTERVAAANLSVDIAPGDAIITGDDIADQGSYLGRSTAVENRVIAAPPASGARVDLVVIRMYDSTSTGGDPELDGPAVEVIEGISGANPVAPAVPDTAIPLAEVTVTAGAAAIVNADIADRRVQSVPLVPPPPDPPPPPPSHGRLVQNTFGDDTVSGTAPDGGEVIAGPFNVNALPDVAEHGITVLVSMTFTSNAISRFELMLRVNGGSTYASSGNIPTVVNGLGLVTFALSLNEVNVDPGDTLDVFLRLDSGTVTFDGLQNQGLRTYWFSNG